MPHLYHLSPSNLSKLLPTTLFLPHYTLTTLASSVLQGCYPLSYIKDFAHAVPASLECFCMAICLSTTRPQLRSVAMSSYLAWDSSFLIYKIYNSCIYFLKIVTNEIIHTLRTTLYQHWLLFLILSLFHCCHNGSLGYLPVSTCFSTICYLYSIQIDLPQVNVSSLPGFPMHLEQNPDSVHGF